MSIIIFLLVLFVLVLVHEWGHFIVAKKVGMRVDEFGIGFPPKLFGIKKGETEYTFNALPIGGFVRILGEDAVQAEGMEDSERAFVNKSKWAQAAVLVAGVAMNILFAWLLFSIAFFVGTGQVVHEDEATSNAALVVTEVVEGSPASEAGISRGANIISLASESENIDALTPTTFRSFVAEHADETLLVTYTLGEEELQTELTAASGFVEGEPDRKVIGVALGMVEVVSLPVHKAIYEGFTRTITGLWLVTVGIFSLLADAVLFQADLSQVAGPVGIVGLVGEASALGVTTLLMFTAFISLNLAVINMLPFPALDGGRLLFVLIEAIKGTPIRPQLAYALNAAGFVLLILLMVAITYNDILRII